MRPTPYKDVTRARCSRCGAKAEAQWSTCAIGNRYVALCRACDVDLNRIALRFVIGPEKADRFVDRYERTR